MANSAQPRALQTSPRGRVPAVVAVFLIILAALRLPPPAAAQPTQLEARLVHEATGAPVAHATVSVVGLAGSTRTDANGRFTWAPSPELPAEFIVILPGGQVTR